MNSTPAHLKLRHSTVAQARRIVLLAAVAALTCGFVPISAKTRAGTGTALSTAGQRETVASMEMRLRPFLEMRAAFRSHRSYHGPATPPSQADLFALTKNWNQLSPQFQELYAQATQIPSGYRSYASPGGHFEVYYTPVNTTVYTIVRDTLNTVDTTNVDITYDAVDTTDRYGYSPTNWHVRTPASNGIPDYVDEIAWALDSSWSMEVDRFGFAEPAPSGVVTGDPTKYKVTATAEPDWYYAFTYPGPPIAGRNGFTSSIELRNEWNGWNIPPYLDYQNHPEKAVRVTCAHELFHGVQYAMARNVVSDVYLDDFPVAWLEGTAVSMEELGFDDVNDYLQYSTGYFAAPDTPMLTDGVPDVYSNGLLALYLYRFAAGSPGISFVKNVYTTNLAQPISFHRSLVSTAAGMGTTFDSLLSGFHTGSFFTDDRADTTRFLPDAALLPQISITATATATAPTRILTVRPYAVGLFGLESGPGQSDTIHIRGVAAGDHVRPVLLVQTDPTTISEYRVLERDNEGRFSTDVLHWKRLFRAVVVVTNAEADRSHRAEVTLAAWGPDILDYGAVTAFPNPTRLTSPGREVSIRGKEFTAASVYSQSGVLVSRTRFNSQSRIATSSSWEFRGKFRIVWNLTNDNGRRVSPGTYALVLTYDEDDMSQQKLQRVLVLP